VQRDTILLRIPDNHELRGFFEADPMEAEPADGYWAYEIADARGVALRFSFNTHERSIQAQLSLGNNLLCSVSSEGATAMRLDGDVLLCDFCLEGAKASLTVKKSPLVINWTLLRAA
jgi:hypothetical protein